jgi:hypothetical protein
MKKFICFFVLLLLNTLCEGSTLYYEPYIGEEGDPVADWNTLSNTANVVSFAYDATTLEPLTVGVQYSNSTPDFAWIESYYNTPGAFSWSSYAHSVTITAWENVFAYINVINYLQADPSKYYSIEMNILNETANLTKDGNVLTGTGFTFDDGQRITFNTYPVSGGTKLEMYQDGVKLLEYSDTTNAYTSGTIAYKCYQTGSSLEVGIYYDDTLVETLETPTDTPTFTPTFTPTYTPTTTQTTIPTITPTPFVHRIKKNYNKNMWFWGN